jgi:hypothetical protein
MVKDEHRRRFIFKETKTFEDTFSKEMMTVEKTKGGIENDENTGDGSS